MSILKGFGQRLKKEFLRMGKRILDVAFQLALITGLFLGLVVAAPGFLIVWMIIASVIGAVVIIVLGLEIDFMLLLLIQFLITVLAIYFIARKKGLWEEAGARPFSTFFN